MKQHIAQFRFYEELNDFLPLQKRKTWFSHSFRGNPSVKDTIEAIGIPHTEVDLILVNGLSVDFSYQIKNGDRISVYPVFESLDISGATRLRAKPLREPKFILDVHLGRLAKYLRMLGFDALYQNDFSDEKIMSIIEKETRIVLTRDRGLLKRKAVTHGYWVRETDPKRQIIEVLHAFDLFSRIAPFTICIACNDSIVSIEKDKIIDRLPPRAGKYFHQFHICLSCKKIYWKGHHYETMVKFIKEIEKKKNLC